MEEYQQIWALADEALNKGLPHVQYSAYIPMIEPFMFENDTLYLRVPNIMYQNILLSKYFDTILNAIYHTSNRNIDIKIMTADEAEAFLAKMEEKKASAPQKIRLNPKYTFESFVVGSNNRFAYAACVAVAEAPSQSYNPLFIYGGAGLGKTHLLHAIGDYVSRINPDANIVYVTTETFTNELIASIQSNKNADFRLKYRNADILMIDDIQFIIGKNSTQEEIFHTLNTLYESGKQIVISSDRPPREMSTLDERLRSRFEMGLTADIQPPEIETRIAILRNKANRESADIDDESLQYIAEVVNTNIRELEGSFNRVIHYAIMTGSPVDINITKEALGNIKQDSSAREINWEDIANTICSYFGISKANLLSDQKNQEFALPRQYAMYLCRDMLNLPYTRIGTLFGRDHSTVMYACRKTAANMENDTKLHDIINDIRFMAKRNDR